MKVKIATFVVFTVLILGYPPRLGAAEELFADVFETKLSPFKVAGKVTSFSEPAEDSQTMVTNSVLATDPFGETHLAVYRFLLPAGVLPEAEQRTETQKAGDPVLEALKEPKGILQHSSLRLADHVLAQLKSAATRDQLAKRLARLPKEYAKFNLRVEKTEGPLAVVHAEAQSDVEQATVVRALNEMADLVDFAEPDYEGVELKDPNDTHYTSNPAYNPQKQWYLPRIKAPQAWDIFSTPDEATAKWTTIAILDSGIDSAHADLMGNVWSARGKDFVDADPPNDQTGHGTRVAGIIGADTNAMTQKGVAGMCWKAKMVMLRIMNTTPSSQRVNNALLYMDGLNSTTAGVRVAVANHSWGMPDFARAVFNGINHSRPLTVDMPADITTVAKWSTGSYLLQVQGTQMNVNRIRKGMTVKHPKLINSTSNGYPMVLQVYNYSTGVTPATATVQISDTPKKVAPTAHEPLEFVDAIQFGLAHQTMHVVAAGGTSVALDLDVKPFFPASYPSDLIITVAASDRDDKKLVTTSIKTNTGKNTVHLFAPGEKILSTYKHNSGPLPSGYIPESGSTTHGYLASDGTSFSAPQVAGALALVRMKHPTWDVAELRALFMSQDAVDPVSSLNALCISGGRLNVEKLLQK